MCLLNTNVIILGSSHHCLPLAATAGEPVGLEAFTSFVQRQFNGKGIVFQQMVLGQLEIQNELFIHMIYITLYAKINFNPCPISYTKIKVK